MYSLAESLLSNLPYEGAAPQGAVGGAQLRHQHVAEGRQSPPPAGAKAEAGEGAGAEARAGGNSAPPP